MELVNGYLREVRRYLPKPQQDDIMRELEENLRSQIEDREAELGRPLNDDDQKAILSNFGSPLDVAARYRTDHRTLTVGRLLIGPALFPFYWKVLRLNVGLSFLVVIILAFALHLGVEQTLYSLLLQATIQTAIITLIFTVAESHVARYPERWTKKGKGGTAPKETNGYPRFDAFAQAVAAGVFLLWLLAIRDSPYLAGGSIATTFRLAPVWGQIYWPTALLAFASMVQGLISLFRPDWTRLRSMSSLVFNGASVLLIGFLLSAGSWVTLGDRAVDPSGERQRVTDWVNRYLYYCLLGVLIFAVIQWLWICVREYRRSHAIASRAS